jgi:hypothetical protein
VDGRKFDRIARSLAARTNRRRALRFVGIGSLVAWWNRARQDSAAQESLGPTPCSQDADCVDGDADACTGATCVDGLCTYFIVDCIPSHVCCGNGSCCPVDEGESCLGDTDCVAASDDPCAGARCEGGSCVPFLATCEPDFACCGNGACCPVGGGCVVDADCASSPSVLGGTARCISGVCVPGATPA